jgi:hypothetical protein
MTLMDKQCRISNQSAVEVAKMSSSSKGEATAATTDLIRSKIDLGGYTSLGTWEC